MKLLSFKHVPAEDVASIQLLPLTPEYKQSHEVYWKAIETALAGKDRGKIRNIALTGSYGVGKSSILQKVAETHRVVPISLSTLGLSDEAADSESKAAASKTNRIQKEIVKQLLYREEPAKMPGSRYRRMERFKFWQALWVAVLVAFPISLVFYLSGWAERLSALFKPYVDLGNAVHLLVLGATSVFVLVSEALFHNRIRVERLSAGAATISLSPASTTFFDEYLDEIVYFFDVTRHDLVIFEDIDRFDEPHIFETLRALNTLLNGAQQLKGQNIRFIYAIKDSIFDALGTRAVREGGDPGTYPQIDAAIEELARANRTKFFDLVIPVVPFITHRSARDLMVRVMDEIEHDVSPQLIDLAARHLADMRLIKNIRNEFVIFREKIIFDEESVPGLNENQLFGMMLYKSTHLSDFEAIKDGRSKLDRLYAEGRKLVAVNIRTLEQEWREIQQRITNLDSVAKRSERLGDALLQYIERLTRHVSVPAHATRTITFAGQTRADDDLQSADFWHEFIEANRALEVRTSGPQGQTYQLSISRADASDVLGDSLSLRDWQDGDKANLEELLTEIRENVDTLSHADMDTLMKREEFRLESSESVLRSFRQIAEEYLDSELAQQLVEAGYISKDFTLYTSTYYAERVSSQATNFIIHNVDRNIADPYFALTPEDVEAVLRERGETVLRERGLYNIDVLDYLLERNSPNVNILINKLVGFGDEEQSFVQAYLAGGTQQTDLIRKLADRWRPIFSFIISEAEVNETTRLQLLNVAVTTMSDEVSYVANEAVRRYFEKHYTGLESFVSNETSAEVASRIARLLAANGARLASLSPLGKNVKKAVIARNRYRITRDNLITAIGGTQNLALDNIQECDPIVYAYVLEHLSDYLAALRESEPEPLTIKSATAFEPIIEDVLEHASDLLSEVVASASPDCQVSTLTDLSEAAWPILAEHLRFPATFGNVRAYIDVIGKVDASLAQLLMAAKAIVGSADSEESEVEAVGAKVLAARDFIPNPETRVSLVRSLNLAEFLPAASIEAESGDLIGLLIDNKIVSDNAESFALTLDTDWPTREFAISKSVRFASYMSPNEVPIDDVAPSMVSPIVPDCVKQVIIERFDEFVPPDDRASLTAIASFAVGRNETLAVELVIRMANAQVEPNLLLRILQPLLAELTEADLVQILSEMGGDYATMSERNGKRPRLPNTEPHLALVKRMELLGVVSSHDLKDGLIVAYMRRD